MIIGWSYLEYSLISANYTVLFIVYERIISNYSAYTVHTDHMNYPKTKDVTILAIFRSLSFEKICGHKLWLKKRRWKVLRRRMFVTRACLEQSDQFNIIVASRQQFKAITWPRMTLYDLTSPWLTPYNLQLVYAFWWYVILYRNTVFPRISRILLTVYFLKVAIEFSGSDSPRLPSILCSGNFAEFK